MEPDALARNLRWYGRYQLLRSLLCWVPVFFLYFQERLSLPDVLRLEALYYAGVVLLEVPSGYLADRLGRRRTLIVACAAAAAGNAVLAFSETFGGLAVGQLLWSAGMAANSGADSALLYDSLDAAGRAQEYAEREGRAQSLGFVGMALAGLTGGALAGVDLRLAYVVTGVAQLGALGAAWRLIEPPARTSLATFAGQLRQCLAVLRERVALWCALVWVAMLVFNHVPYTFYQGWLDLWLDEGSAGYRRTPLLSGVLLSAMMLVAAGASRHAAGLGRRIGAPAAVLTMIALQLGLIAAMAWRREGWVLGLLLLRTVPGAIQRPLLGQLVNVRTPGPLRATTLSLLSLAGRLGFSVSLTLVSLGPAGTGAGWGPMAASLRAYVVAGLVTLAVLAVVRPRRLTSM